MNAEDQSVTIRFKNVTTGPAVVVLEPWANEYVLLPGAAFDIVDKGGQLEEPIEIQVGQGRATFFARSRSTISAVQDGEVLT
jgi:hypothetical protein